MRCHVGSIYAPVWLTGLLSSSATWAAIRRPGVPGDPCAGSNVFAGGLGTLLRIRLHVCSDRAGIRQSSTSSLHLPASPVPNPSPALSSEASESGVGAWQGASQAKTIKRPFHPWPLAMKYCMPATTGSKHWRLRARTCTKWGVYTPGTSGYMGHGPCR